MMHQKVEQCKLYKRTPTAVQKERYSLAPATLPRLKINLLFACLHPTSSPTLAGLHAGHLTKRALHKMYEITGSCRRWPRMSRPLMSSVTEPPLHSWEGDRETPVTRSSLTTLDYDSWGELAHTHKSGEAMQHRMAAREHQHSYRWAAVTN